MPSTLESDLASLLRDLLAGQNELLDTLSRKRTLLANADAEGLSAIAAEEHHLIENLQDCVRRREDLLARAANERLPSANIQSLAAALPTSERRSIKQQLQQAGAQARLLRHQSLVNWVVVQRTLIHLSQLLEIIATGGRLQPTYGKGVCASTGNLVDGAV
jgi:hypothetical protein